MYLLNVLVPSDTDDDVTVMPTKAAFAVAQVGAPEPEDFRICPEVPAPVGA